VTIGSDPGRPATDHSPAINPAPTYTYTVLAAGAPVPQIDPATGLSRPRKDQLVTKVYRLEGNLTRRVLAAGTAAPAEARLEPEVKQDKKDKNSKKRK
jgi:hypothetical protein